MKKIIALVISFLLFQNGIIYSQNFITTEKEGTAFTIAENGKAAPIFYSNEDYPGVIRVIKQLSIDIKSVTNTKPEIYDSKYPPTDFAIIVGTLNKSSLIKKLIEHNKIDLKDLEGKWEQFYIQTAEEILPGVKKALLIIGSDKRGTIFGIYDLSEKIGVSPWYWWADVPVKKKQALYVKPVKYTMGEPAVQYRGIFINDEAPALTGWAYEKFGGFNHQFYQHVFELILRLKGNFLWPAMWGKSFFDDDSLNHKLADEYGIVISTSHHEPMMRAHVEWARYGKGPWNYTKNDSVLREFWREGIKRMNGYESIITIGMRGDGDEPMSQEANIALLERIVKDQRNIIEEVTGKKAEEVPQVWALYKEVQDYYDKGMRVPDDVTLLLCDDNWGNIRKLPDLNEKQRKGGYGIYYHYDYVGGPRNYKWINTNQIERVWEQMHLAFEYGARKIWVVNVGDIKPMEFPIEFFLDYAWNPDFIPLEKLGLYSYQWAKEKFGEEFAGDIADILNKYTKYNSRRKPELLSPETYSLVNFREFETVVDDYKILYENAKLIYEKLPAEYHDAYYQLVLHPVEASSNLYELYYFAAKNRLYAKQKRILTNQMAQKVRELFERDSLITEYYHTQIADGKWNHMMSQTHIGYTYWQQPEKNVIPKYEIIDNPHISEMGVAVEGSEDFYPNSKTLELPPFESFYKQKHYFEIFNRGNKPFDYEIIADDIFIIENKTATIETENRLWISVDWQKVKKGINTYFIKVLGPGNEVCSLKVVVKNPESFDCDNNFIETNNYISIKAHDYSRKIESGNIKWVTIPNLGRTSSAVTFFPVTESINISKNSPHLEYDIYLFSKGNVNVHVYLSPTLDFNDHHAEDSIGLRLAVSIDNNSPVIINMHKGINLKMWEKWVAENINIQTTTHVVDKPGKHVLKIWAIDPGVVIQKIVLETGKIGYSYLGPPEMGRRD
ncbi:glycosyl hydrolase 115 family protein [Melioribacter sp. OK-6-Me]|uniref:glycosyl hydrolase 115 family protein n=1 Tax=unclassified Melioribacter TaxID=2627329 RepID=UPI003EDA3242